jgi:hypothetical protein
VTDSDDLADLLAPSPPTPVHNQVREQVLRATTRTMHRRRWARRARLTAAAASLFTLGGVAGWLVKPTPTAVDVVPLTVPIPIPIPQPPAPGSPPSPGSEDTIPGEQLELRAEQSTDPAEAARLYRLAGDRYLNAKSDYVQAARCYRLHLLSAGPAQRGVRADDSWLLTSLKASHAPEKTDESKTDS